MPLKTPILITGASGFVGANLLRRLIREVPPKKVHVLLRPEARLWRIEDILRRVSAHVVDMRNAGATERFIRKIKPKTIFHLATHGGYPQEQHDERAILETNVLCTFNLIRSCLELGFDAFVNTGSSSEYGAKDKPMKEGDILAPITAYGASKAWATLYCQYLACEQRAPIVTLRPFEVYGPYEPLGRLVPNLIWSFIKHRDPALSSPKNARDFVFVDDLVEAYILAAKRPYAGTIFNIGSGRQSTIREVFEMIKAIMRSDAKPLWGKEKGRSFDTSRWVADIKLAKRCLAWRPETTLREGLLETINWFQANTHLYESR